MLIEFSVTNFRSFRERQRLSLGASAAKEHSSRNTFSTGIQKLPPLVRSAAIYGPNGSSDSGPAISTGVVEIPPHHPFPDTYKLSRSASPPAPTNSSCARCRRTRTRVLPRRTRSPSVSKLFWPETRSKSGGARRTARVTVARVGRYPSFREGRARPAGRLWRRGNRCGPPRTRSRAMTEGRAVGDP